MGGIFLGLFLEKSRFGPHNLNVSATCSINRMR